MRTFLLLTLALLLSACQPTPEGNVLGYLLNRQLNALATPLPDAPTGSLAGRVLATGAPIPDATVLVAGRTGTPYVAHTDAQGRYLITGIPPDQYSPAAVAPGYAESALTGLLGTPALVTIRADATTTAPDLKLTAYRTLQLPANLPQAVNLRQTAAYTATAPFPDGSTAQVRAFAFDYNGVTVDSLRLYLPITATPAMRFPLVVFIAPTAIDDWSQVSVAFAGQGYAVVGISPMAARGVDADEQAMDTRVAMALAQTGALGPEVGQNRPVVMGGSYSSAILARLVRMLDGDLAGWISVGGLANAFTGARDYYDGKIEMPENYRYLAPALGPPNLYPLALLLYSPVYTADEFPPTLIIHTAADKILPIEQAYELAAALQAAGVPVETYYYTDESHYLGIGENLTDAGKEMFGKIIAFLATYSGE